MKVCLQLTNLFVVPLAQISLKLSGSVSFNWDPFCLGGMGKKCGSEKERSKKNKKVHKKLAKILRKSLQALNSCCATTCSWHHIIVFAQIVVDLTMPHFQMRYAKICLAGFLQLCFEL